MKALRTRIDIGLAIIVVLFTALLFGVFSTTHTYALSDLPTATPDCIESPPTPVLKNPFVTTAHAAFFDPLRDPKTNIPDPFFYGIILHGCNPPTVDLRADGSNGPISIPSGTAATLSWTTTSEHGGIACTTGGPWISPGSRPPSGSESTGTLSTGTYTYFLFCSDADGPASDNVTINVGTGPSATIDKSAPPGPFARGSLVPITITYSYANQTSPVTIEDDLNDHLDFVGMITPGFPAPSGVTAAPGDVLSWTFDPPSGSDTFSFNVLILNSAPDGPIGNTATIRDGHIPTSDTANIPVAFGPAIRGDIYANGQISGLTVRGPAVVSSGSGTPSINQIGPEIVWRVSNYAPRLVPTWKNTMDANMTRLLRERAKQLGSNTYSGSFDIDGSPNRLGGEVWKISGGLTLGEGDVSTSFSGRGTIIVENGDVVIHRDVTSSEPVGIVARTGSIRIEPTVSNLTNLEFYAPLGTIQFQGGGGVLTAFGSFIARQFEFGPREYALTYTTNVALKPPPGFVSFILPTILERAP